MRNLRLSQRTHPGRPISWKEEIILAVSSSTRTCFVLWQCYSYMFCIVTVLCVHVFYCDSVIRTCFVLWQCYAYMFCIVTVLCVHVFLLWQCYAYMFCIVTVLCVHVLYCDSVYILNGDSAMLTFLFVLWQR